jgi:hypothetical protein
MLGCSGIVEVDITVNPATEKTPLPSMMSPTNHRPSSSHLNLSPSILPNSNKKHTPNVKMLYKSLFTTSLFITTVFAQQCIDGSCPGASYKGYPCCGSNVKADGAVCDFFVIRARLLKGICADYEVGLLSL